MATFEDANGDKWSFTLLRPHFKRVQQELGIDLLAPDNMEILRRLLDDPATIVDVVSVILTDEIREKHRQCGSTDAVEIWFAKRMRGDALDWASDAILQEIVDFFPTRRRAAMQAALNKTRELIDLSVQEAVTLIQSGKLEQSVRDEMAKVTAAIDAALAGPGNSSSVPVDTSEPTQTG